MAVSERDREHFRRLAEINAEEDRRRVLESAERQPQEKLREGLELSSFHMQLAIDASGGDVGGVTGLSEQDLLGQASLASHWRNRKRNPGA